MMAHALEVCDKTAVASDGHRMKEPCPSFCSAVSPARLVFRGPPSVRLTRQLQRQLHFCTQPVSAFVLHMILRFSESVEYGVACQLAWRV